MSYEEDAEFLFSTNISLLLSSEETNIPKKKRKSPNNIFKERLKYGEFHHLYLKLRESEHLFFEYTRMSTATFDYICNEIRDECRHQITNFKKPIGVEERLIVTLRYLATGLPFRQLAFSYRISKTAVANIVSEMCTAIWKKLQPKHMKFPSTADFKTIADSYDENGKFPHCCGSIDGKHIRVKKPKKSGSMFFNYKGYFSIVLLAVSDSNRKFRIIDVGAYGKDSDGGVLSNSAFFKKFEDGTFQLPPAERIGDSNIGAPYVFLGDEAFPLTTFLMRPFPRRSSHGDEIKTLFNRNLSASRSTVECSFGIAAAKFRILHKPIETSVKNACKVVKAVCILHNLIIDKEGLNLDVLTERTDDFLTSSNLIPSWENNRASTAAIAVREKFCLYFFNNV